MFRSFVLSFSLRVLTWKTKQTLGVCNILLVHEELLCNNRTLWLVNILLHFKTFNKFCSVFRGALIDCKSLQSISKNEMLADICVSLFEILALNFCFPNLIYMVGICQKKNLNKKLSIFTPCNTLKGGHYQKWAHLGFALCRPLVWRPRAVPYT